MSHAFKHFFVDGIDFRPIFKVFLLAFHDDVPCFEIEYKTYYKNYNDCRN